MKKLIRFLGFLFLLLLFAVGLLLVTGERLPQGSDQIIQRVLNEEPPQLITGKTGYANSNNVNIWHESIGDPALPTVLLIMGHSASAMLWPKTFYQPMIDAGYHVVRFDNRGVGMSDWIKDWSANAPYSLEDMAEDALAVLDKLAIDKAHVIGVSMGGMIAQRLAIDHKDRLLSMTSIMSSAYAFDPELTNVKPGYAIGIARTFLKYGLRDTDENAIRFGLGVHQQLLGDGDYELDVEKIGQVVMFERKYRNGFNPDCLWQHTEAVRISGSRLDQLDQIKIPTLVVHGTSDPLVHPDHCHKYASLIHDAEILWVEGMGHDFPKPFQPHTVCTIINHLNKTQQTLMSLNSSN